MRRFALLFLWLSSPLCLADDWAQFPGPQRDSTSRETGLLAAFPKGWSKVLWERGMGPGYSGAAVKGNAVYILDRQEDKGVDLLFCLNLANGQEKWRFSYASKGKKLQYTGRVMP